MAIQTETVELNGRTFDHTWSDAGYRIERDGCVYDEAYDPEGSNREYTETDEPVETGDTDTSETEAEE